MKIKLYRSATVGIDIDGFKILASLYRSWIWETFILENSFSSSYLLSSIRSFLISIWLISVEILLIWDLIEFKDDKSLS